MAKKKEQEQQPEDQQPETPEPTTKATKTVKLVRGVEFGEPTSADVHPDEVQNYLNAGWERK